MNKDQKIIYLSDKLNSICLLKSLVNNKTVKNIEISLSRNIKMLKFLEILKKEYK